MMENIFEGAKFGDKFLTRDGSLALFIKWDNCHPVLIDETFRSLVRVHQDGWFWRDHKQETPSDIISRYQEIINEEKLDELAEKYSRNYYNWMNIFKAYKAGYRKAMEE